MTAATAPPPAADRQGLDAFSREQVTQGAAILTIAGATSFAGVFMARGGLGDNPKAIAILFAMTVAPVWVSAAALICFGRSRLGAACAFLLGFLSALLLPIAGLAFGHAALFALFLLMLIAIAVLARDLLRAASHGPVTILLAGLLFAILLVLFTAPSRLFLPEAITLGLAPSDNYEDLAIAQMLGHYGAISLGADGLAHDSYHFLSHLIAAGLSRGAAAPLPLIYLYWGALTLKLQLIWCLFAAGLLLLPPARHEIILRLLYAGLLMLLVGGLESESFLQGAALYAAGLPLLLALMDNGGVGGRARFAALALAGLFVLLCAFAKLSAGFFGGVALLLLLWKARRNFADVAMLVAGLTLVVLATYVLVLPRDLSQSSAPFLLRAQDYYQNYFNLTTVLSYATPFMVMLFLTMHPRISRGANTFLVTWDALPRPRFAVLDQSAPAAILSGLSLLACLLVLVIAPIGSNIAYFSLYIYLLGLLLLPLALAQSGAKVSRSCITKSLAAVMGLWLIVSTIPFVTGLTPLLSALYGAASGQKAYGGHVATEIRQSLRETRTPFGTLKERIAATPWTRFIASLRHQADAVHGDLVVAIAPAADEVWRRLSAGTAWWCMAPQLMIPAETGLAEIRSIAPGAIERECAPPGILWYGFGKYQDQHRATLLSDRELCALAQPLRARAVYRLVSYRDPARNELVHCEP